MLDGAGGLEGRGRPSKGLQRKDATIGASWSAIGAKPLWKCSFSQTLTGFVKSCTSPDSFAAGGRR